MTTDLATSLAQNDTRPLPLIVAEKWNFPLQHYQRFDVEGGHLFAVQDWIAGLTESTTTKSSEMWRKLKKQTRISNTSLPYSAADGKTYERDFANAKGLFLIAQKLRVTHEREQLSIIPGLSLTSPPGTLSKYWRRGEKRILKSPLHAMGRGFRGGVNA